jgi:error-prone DNA polymerase
VPIFQEQLLRLAMTAAGFSGGEAEELRRAMGFKRSLERMDRIEERLRAGMAKKGFSEAAQEEIVRHITSFALYGFPESHSASFALIAYASSYLKCHHPAAFLAGLLNAWPMGFYSPATLVKDAQRHDVEVRPVDVTQSDWRCTLEPGAPAVDGKRVPPAVRIGLRYARGLREDTALGLARARAIAPFTSLADLVKRVALHADELDALAELGALAWLDRTPVRRRAALWQVAGIERDRGSLFAGHMPRDEGTSPLEELSPLETTLADYRIAGLTTGPQIMTHLRPGLRERGILAAAELKNVPDGAFVRTAGHVIVRQRPGSAKGFLFVTLEDETGLANAILTPKQVERFRAPLHASNLLEIAGPVQNVDGVIHVKLRQLVPLDLGAILPASRSYR